MEQLVVEIFTGLLAFMFIGVVCYAIYDHVKGGFEC